MEIKVILSILNLFCFSLMLSQSPFFESIVDITPSVSIDNSRGERSLMIIQLEGQDTFYTPLPFGEFEILKAVKNEFIINVVFRSPEEKFKNNICHLAFGKIGKEWEVTESHVPLSMRYMYKKVRLNTFDFPDINTLLVSYVNEEKKVNDVLFRFTKHGIVQYDCFDSTSTEREEIRNSIFGTLPVIRLRPTN